MMYGQKNIKFYLSISPCFGHCVPIIRRNNYVYATRGTCHCVWMTVLYAGWNTRRSSTQNNKYQVSHKHCCFSWWWAHSGPKHVEIDEYIKIKYTKNKLCTNLALFTKKNTMFVICRRAVSAFESSGPGVVDGTKRMDNFSKAAMLLLYVPQNVASTKVVLWVVSRSKCKGCLLLYRISSSRVHHVAVTGRKLKSTNLGCPPVP